MAYQSKFFQSGAYRSAQGASGLKAAKTNERQNVTDNWERLPTAISEERAPKISLPSTLMTDMVKTALGAGKNPVTLLPSAIPAAQSLTLASDRAAAREDAYAQNTIAMPNAPDTRFVKTLPAQISAQSKPTPLPLSRSYADAVADKKAEASRAGFDLAGMRRRGQAMQPTAEAAEQLQAQEGVASRLSSEYQDMSQRYQGGRERLFYTGLADQKERLERVRSAPDFEEKVSEAAHGNYGGLALPWDSGGARRAAAAIATGDYRVDAKLQYMTDDERKVFQYYAGSGDYAGAQEYLDTLDRYLNARQQQDFSEQQRADAEEHPVKGAVTNIAASFFNGAGYVRNAAQAAENAATGEYVPTDYNAPYFGFAHLTRDTAQGVHQAAYDAGGSVGALAADVGLSLGQMGSKLAGGSLPTLLFTGANAAEGTTLDSLERGATPGQALVTGTIAGAVEILTEKLPVDNLFRIARSTPGTLRQTIVQILKQAGSEGTQEMISELANNLTDQAVMGDKSQYELYIQSLVAQGMERGQAEREATRQFYLDNVLQAGAAGAVSGGIMGAGAQAVGRIGTYRSGAPDRAIDRAYSAMEAHGPFGPEARAANQQAVTMLPMRGENWAATLPGFRGQSARTDAQGAESVARFTDTPVAESGPQTQKNASTGETADYFFDASDPNNSWKDRTYTQGTKTFVQSADRQRMYEVPQENELNFAVENDGTVVLSDDIVGNLNKDDYRDFIKAYAELNLITVVDPKTGAEINPKPVTIQDDGTRVIITQTGINDVTKKIRGAGIKNQDNVSSILLLNHIIENARRLDTVENKHGGTTTFTDYTARFSVGGREYSVLLHIKNAKQGDRYHYHTLEKIDVGPTDGSNSTNGAGTYQASPTSSNPIIPQADEGVNAQSAQPGGEVSGDGVGAANMGFTGDTERGFSKNMASDQKMHEDIREDYQLDPEMYHRLGNRETLEKAQAIFNEGLDSAHSKLEQAIGAAKKGAKLSPEMVPLSRLVANELAKGGDLDGARRILSDVAVELTTSGQLSQAANILRNADPVTKADSIQKLVDRMNEKLGGKKQKITVDQELLDQYVRAEGDTQRDAALDKVYQTVAGQIPSTLMDKFNALRYLNMLGNLKTQGRNILGNLAMQPVRIAKDKVAAAFEALAYHASRGRFQRTKSFLYAPALFKAAGQDYANVKAAAMGEQKFAMSGASGAQVIDSQRTIFKNSGAWGTLPDSSKAARAARKITDIMWVPLEGYRKLTNWAMDAGDLIFSRFTYSDALAGFLSARGVTAKQLADGSVDVELLEQARAYAVQEAQKATYRDNNQFSDMVASIGFKNADTTAKKAANTVLQGTLPFRRTPANVLARAEEYSPLGLVNTAIKAAQRARGAENVTGADVIDSLSASLTGTGIFALGMALFANGLLTGGPDDDDKQAEFDNLTGKQNYALTLPDGTSFTLDWLSPVSMPLFMGVEFARNGLENGYSFGDLLDAASSITNPMLQMSMLQGVNDQLESVSYSENPMVDLMLNSLMSYMTQGLTSTLLGQAERTSEDKRMTTYTDKGGTLSGNQQYALGRTSAKIPGWDFQQIPYIDAWGREEATGTLPMRAVSNLLLPGYLGKENKTEADQEIQRLYDATGEAGVLPSRAGKTLTVKGSGEKVNLDAKQYVAFASKRGQTAYELVEELIQSGTYRRMDDGEKAAAITLAYTYAQQVAGKEIAPEYELDKWVSLAQTARRELGLSEAEYLALYGIYGDAQLSGDKIRAAYKLGIEPEEWISFYKNLDANANGSISQEEAQAAINAAGIPHETAKEIWNIINKGWKANPYQ